jgi:Protein of unknown function (DUF3102)
MRHISQVTNTKRNTQFEYQTLPSQKRVSVQNLTLEIKENLRQTVQTIWIVGKKLVEVRSQIELWQFSSWLQVEFDWSRRTAYNFINVYEAFPELGCAKFARVDISISALYLLAAPSTQPAIRHDFLNRALAGEYVTHKVIQTAIQVVNAKQTEDITGSIHELPSVDDIVQIESQLSPMGDSTAIILRPAWNSILQGRNAANNNRLLLFWGDTTSPRFIERLPTDAFVLAIPSSKWHHEWLLSKRISSITLFQPMLKEELVESLLSAFCLEEKSLILPWLPHWKIIDVALRLKIKVYAGDPELDRCEQTIHQLGLSEARIDWCQW